LQLEEGWVEPIGAIGLLARGNVTFAQYNQSRVQRLEEIDKKVQDAIQKKEQKTAALQKEELARSQLLLACVGESPANLRGVEFNIGLTSKTTLYMPVEEPVRHQTCK